MTDIRAIAAIVALVYFALVATVWGADVSSVADAVIPRVSNIRACLVICGGVPE